MDVKKTFLCSLSVLLFSTVSIFGGGKKKIIFISNESEENWEATNKCPLLYHWVFPGGSTGKEHTW